MDMTHSKTGKEVAQALKSIFRDGDTLRADKMREWLNKTVQKLLKVEGIHFFHTQNEPKANTCRENNSMHWKTMPGILWMVDFKGKSYNL